MAGRKIKPGQMDSVDLLDIRDEWHTLASHVDPDKDWGMDERDYVHDFVRDIWPHMDEILNILDEHINGPDGMTHK